MATETDSPQGTIAPEPFTRPFGFSDRLVKPRTGLDWVPVVDLAVVALLVSLLFTRFVVFPGVQVDLPGTGMQMQQASGEVAVLTVGNNGMLFFNGSVHEAASIPRALRSFVAESGEGEIALLIKVRASLDMQAFLDLCEAAQAAGFTQVQVSGRKPEGNVPGGIGGVPGPAEPGALGLP